jgi:hypothetical protein
MDTTKVVHRGELDDPYHWYEARRGPKTHENRAHGHVNNWRAYSNPNYDCGDHWIPEDSLSLDCTTGRWIGTCVICGSEVPVENEEGNDQGRLYAR